MRVLLPFLCFCCLLGIGAARAEGIVEVLQRSQQVRLAARGAGDADSAGAQRVRASLARLLRGTPEAEPVELVWVRGDLFAEALFGGRRLAVSEAVGDLPEGERLLMLAHELGHLSLGHWGGLSALYLSHIPAAVRPETTDPVAARLGAEAHLLSHRQEFEADAYGYTLVRRLGFGLDHAFGLLQRQGSIGDSATHPGTRRRLAQLRALDGRISLAWQQLGDTETFAAKPGAIPP